MYVPSERQWGHQGRRWGAGRRGAGRGPPSRWTGSRPSALSSASRSCPPSSVRSPAAVSPALASGGSCSSCLPVLLLHARLLSQKVPMDPINNALRQIAAFFLPTFKKKKSPRTLGSLACNQELHVCACACVLKRRVWQVNSLRSEPQLRSTASDQGTERGSNTIASFPRPLVYQWTHRTLQTRPRHQQDTVKEFVHFYLVAKTPLVYDII